MENQNLSSLTSENGNQAIVTSDKVQCRINNWCFVLVRMYMKVDVALDFFWKVVSFVIGNLETYFLVV